MAILAVEGAGPISVTEGGIQYSVPLSALQVEDGMVTAIDPLAAYASAAQGWAQYLWNRGRLWASASAPSAPAMVFEAVQAGAEGNDIEVTITVPDAGKPDEFDLTVTESETYAGVSPAALTDLIGTATTPGRAPGLVSLVEAAVNMPAPLSAKLQVVSEGNAATLEVLMADGTTPAFTLCARGVGSDGALTDISITEVNDAAGTFKLTAVWSKLIARRTTNDVADAPVSYAVSIAPPADSPFATPCPGTYLLRGGAKATDAIQAAVVVNAARR